MYGTALQNQCCLAEILVVLEVVVDRVYSQILLTVWKFFVGLQQQLFLFVVFSVDINSLDPRLQLSFLTLAANPRSTECRRVSRN